MTRPIDREASRIAAERFVDGEITLAEFEDVQAQIRAQRNPKKLTGWRRITSATACDFCVMLASRGAVYNTADSADFEAHTADAQGRGGTCQCTIEPVWDKAPDPPEIVALRNEFVSVTQAVVGNKAKIVAWRRHWRNRDEVRVGAVDRDLPPATTGRTGQAALDAAVNVEDVPSALRAAGAPEHQVLTAELELRRYQGSRFANLNEHLYGMPQGEIARMQAKQTLEGIDPVFKRARLADNVVVYRGSKTGLLRDLGDDTGDLTGREWVSPAFQSTSANKRIADGFARGAREDGRPTVMTISAPKGTPAVSLSRRFDSGDPNNVSEAEIVLGRDLRYRVTKDHGVGSDGVRRLDVEIVPVKVAAPAAADVSKLTVPQLRTLARERGVTIPVGAKKADIVRLLDEGPPSAPGIAARAQAAGQPVPDWAGRPAPPMGDGPLALAQAVRDLELRPGQYVSLAEIRAHPAMARLTRAEQDEAIGEAHGVRGISLISWDNRKQITDRDRAAAWPEPSKPTGPLGPRNVDAVRIEFEMAPSAVPVKATKAVKAVTPKVLPPLSDVPAVRKVQIDNRIREAYRDIRNQPGQTDFVMLADLRDHPALAGLARSEVDDALRTINRGDYPGDAVVVPQSNQKVLTARERAAAVEAGGQSKHAVSFADPSPRKVPPPTIAQLKATAIEGAEVLSQVPVRFVGVRPNTSVVGGRVSAAQREELAEALRSYVSGSAGDIGRVLRGTMTPDSATQKFAQRVAAALDDAMQKSRLGSDVVVWRGMRSGRGIFGAAKDGDLAGFEWTDASFVSTATTQAGTRNFARLPGGDESVVLRIATPRGTGAVVLDAESEVLLQRGLRFRVVADHGMAGGSRLLDVEVIPTATKAVKAITPKVPPPTIAQLKATAAERGIPIPPKATKAQLVKLVQATPDEVTKLQQAAAREATQLVESGRGTARLLAEVDELISQGADKATIRQRLNVALTEPGQVFAGADPAVLKSLRDALGDATALRAAVTKASTKAKVKPIGRAGQKTRFDPDTMDGPGVPKGAQVVVVRRGSTLTLPDGKVIQLEKARVQVVTKPAPAVPTQGAPFARPGVDALPVAPRPPTAATAAKATNPKFGSTTNGPTYRAAGKAGQRYDPSMGSLPSGAFEENCTNVVMAFEMRMRGYRVMARPLDVLDKHGYAAGRTFDQYDQLLLGWRLPGGRPHGRSFKTQSWITTEELTDVVAKWPEGGRGLVHAGKHTFNVVKKNGRMQFIEAQSAGLSGSVTPKYLKKYGGPGGRWKVIRLDDLEPSDDILEAVEAGS